jgi:prephenate dehydrogenase
VQVELDAFSGRPNPRWELTGSEAAEFTKRLHDLKPSRNRAEAFEGLGYRGFIVRTDGEEIRVYRGIAIRKRGSNVEVLDDSHRTLERWLFHSARGHVDEGALQYVGSELMRE